MQIVHDGICVGVEKSKPNKPPLLILIVALEKNVSLPLISAKKANVEKSHAHNKGQEQPMHGGHTFRRTTQRWLLRSVDSPACR